MSALYHDGGYKHKTFCRRDVMLTFRPAALPLESVIRGQTELHIGEPYTMRSLTM